MMSDSIKETICLSILTLATMGLAILGARFKKRTIIVNNTMEPVNEDGEFASIVKSLTDILNNPNASHFDKSAARDALKYVIENRGEYR